MNTLLDILLLPIMVVVMAGFILLWIICVSLIAFALIQLSKYIKSKLKEI